MFSVQIAMIAGLPCGGARRIVLVRTFDGEREG